MKYYVQTQAPAGNFSDCLGTDDLQNAKDFAEFQRKELGKVARVIERTDVVVEEAK